MDGYIKSLEDDIALKYSDAFDAASHKAERERSEHERSGASVINTRRNLGNNTVFDGTAFEEPTSNGKNNIFFIDGTLSYPNGDMFTGNFHKNNDPRWGTFTYHNGSTYTGYNGSSTYNGSEDGPLYDGVGIYTTARNTQYKGGWRWVGVSAGFRSTGFRHGNNIKYVSNRPVEGGEYNSSGIIVNGFKFFRNCLFQGTFEDGIPHHGQAVYFTGDRFEGFFHEVPLYEKNKQIDSSSSSIPIPQTKIIVPMCKNGTLFVQNKEVSLKCKYDVDVQPNFTKFKSMYSHDDVVDLNPVEQSIEIEQGIEIDIVLHPLGPGEIPAAIDDADATGDAAGVATGIGVAMPSSYVSSEGGKLKFKSKLKFKTNNRKNKYGKSKKNKTKTKYTRRQKRRLQSKRKN